jgi:Ankyrin repeats (many copies)
MRGSARLLLLLRDDIDVNKTDKYRRSPLHIACEYGHSLVVKELLQCQRYRCKQDHSTLSLDAIACCDFTRAPTLWLVCWLALKSIRLLLTREAPCRSISLLAKDVQQKKKKNGSFQKQIYVGVDALGERRRLPGSSPADGIQSSSSRGRESIRRVGRCRRHVHAANKVRERQNKFDVAQVSACCV